MRVRTLLAAITAATLALSGAVGVALPAQAAECETDCLEVTLDSPDQIGAGGGWSDATLTIAHEIETPIMSEVRFYVTAETDLNYLGFQIQQYVDGAWEALNVSSSGDGGLYAQTQPFELSVGTTEVPLRIRATSAMFMTIAEAILADLSEVDLVLGGLDQLQGASLDLTISADARALVLDPPEEITELTGSASVTTTVSLIDVDVPTTLPVTIGEPTELDAGFSNQTGSDYSDVLLLPAYLPGTSLEGDPGDGVLIEVRIDGEWVPVPDLVDLPTDEFFLDLLLSAQDGESVGLRWRITVTDESLLTDTDSGEDEGIPTNVIVWLAVGDAIPEFPVPGVLQMSTTTLTLAEVDEDEDEPTPTETATAPVPDPDDSTDDTDGTDDTDPGETPGEGSTDDANDDTAAAGDGVDSGVADAGDGAAPTGEVAQTGYDLTGQAAAALLLLVVGGIAVLAGVRRRKAEHV